MKLFCSSLLLLLLFSYRSQAQDSAKKENIKALFAVMHQDTLMIKTIDAMTSSMVTNMSAMFADLSYANSGVDVAKLTEKLMTRSMQRSKEMSLHILNEDMVSIYSKYFTMQEIEEFTAFYKSKSGQRLLYQMPDITKDLMAVMTTKYQSEYKEAIIKDVEEITKEMTKQTNKEE